MYRLQWIKSISFDNAATYIRNIKSITILNDNNQIIEELNIADISILDEDLDNSDRVIFLKENIPEELHWGWNGPRSIPKAFSELIFTENQNRFADIVQNVPWE